MQTTEFMDIEFTIASVLYDGGRSGSVFLQSLLDNHSQVITFPSTLLIGGLTGTHFDNFYKQNVESSIVDLAHDFVQKYSTAFNSTLDLTATRLDTLGPEQNQQIKVDPLAFTKCLTEILKKGPRSYRLVFLAIHYAYALAQGKDLSKKMVIVHALHTPEEEKMTMFCTEFPEAKHLVSVRSPISSHSSRYLHHIDRFKFQNTNTHFYQDIASLEYPLNMTRDLLMAFKVIGS